MTGVIPCLGPDGKTQATVVYEGLRPVGLVANIKEHVVDTMIGDQLDRAYELKVNEAGEFTMGGPRTVCGLIGRKVIVDTYGGAARNRRPHQHRDRRTRHLRPAARDHHPRSRPFATHLPTQLRLRPLRTKPPRHLHMGNDQPGRRHPLGARTVIRRAPTALRRHAAT